MDVPPLSADESLVRAFFCPEQHNGEEFLPNAVSLDDLKARGFSVDRPHLTPLSVLLHRLRGQIANNPENRVVPKFSQLFYQKLIDDKDEEGKHFFEVQASPVAKSDVAPENRGHASVFSADRNLGKGSLRKVRTALIGHLNNVVALTSLAYVADVEDQGSVLAAESPAE